MTRDEMLDKREDVLKEFDAQVDVDLLSLEEKRWYTAELLADEVVQLRKQLDSSERIIDALREPSEGIMMAAIQHLEGDLTNMFQAAVAAAEKEVEA